MAMNNLLYKVFKPIDLMMSRRNGGDLLKVGEAAPEFEVQSHEGKTVKLSDFRGKHIVLWFFPKADTPGCTVEGCTFRDQFQNFTKKNVIVLGVSFDAVEANRAFAKKFQFPFQLLCDVDRKLGVAYGACKDASAASAARIGYWIDKSGVVRAVYPQADAATFPEAVLNEIPG